MDVGHQIRKRRTEMGMTQDELAAQLHVVRTTVSNWEVGRNYPDLQMIVRISEVLGISLDQLLKGDEALVQQISEDTAERKKLGKSNRKLTVTVILLAAVVMVLGLALYTRYHQTEVSDPQEIAQMYVDGSNTLHIDLDIPGYETITAWMADSVGNGTVRIEISKRVDLSMRHDHTIEIPICTDEPSGVFSKTFMEENGIHRIAIVSGEDEVRTIELEGGNAGD